MNPVLHAIMRLTSNFSPDLASMRASAGYCCPASGGAAKPAMRKDIHGLVNCPSKTNGRQHTDEEKISFVGHSETHPEILLGRGEERVHARMPSRSSAGRMETYITLACNKIAARHDVIPKSSSMGVSVQSH